MPHPSHLLDYIRQVLAEYVADKPVRRGQVFNAYTRGEAPAGSDLIVEKAAPTGWACSSYADDLQEKPGVKVDLGGGVSDCICRYIDKGLRR